MIANNTTQAAGSAVAWGWRLVGIVLLGLAFVLFVGLQEVDSRLFAALAFLLRIAGATGGSDSAAYLTASFVWVGILLLAAGGFACLKRAKRYRVSSADEAVVADPRSPVLYLRSFNADEKTSRLTSLSRKGITTDEEELALAMGTVGPFIAVGRPGEELPQLGAARMQLEDTSWQDRVVELMSRASLIVLRAGDSPGFWWEFEQAMRVVEPRRCVMLVPFGRRHYEIFRKQAQQHTGKSEPQRRA
jgi:hypothetical protein